MANRENGSANDTPRTDWEPTDEELAALMDGVGEPPLDIEEELVIRAFKARLRAESPRAASTPAPSSGRGKIRLRPGTVQLRLEGLEDRAPSAFPFALNPVLAGAGSAASLALLADGLPDAMQQSFPLLATPASQAGSAAPAGRWRGDTGVVDQYFSSGQPLCGSEFQGTTSCRQMTGLPQEFLAAVRQSPNGPGAARHETLSVDRAFAEGGYGRLLPEVGAVLLLGGLRIEPLRASPHHRASAVKDRRAGQCEARARARTGPLAEPASPLGLSASARRRAGSGQ